MRDSSLFPSFVCFFFTVVSLCAWSATITEQWEDEYSKVGKVLHKYALNTKFKALRGVMVVPSTKEVVWLTEKCSFQSSGLDDCDFYLQNVQTLLSIEENPICRRAGGLSFSLDPWDTSEVWGKSYRKVYYPEACASILRTSIAGATMFDADWDLKHLVNNTLGIGSNIEGYHSIDEWEGLGNLFIDPLTDHSRGSTTAAATVYTMTRLWVAVTGIEEATTPDHSVLYFGNVSIEVRAASVVKNVSALSGFSDSPAPPPVAYRRFVDHINRHMGLVMQRLKSFRQLAQLAVAQEAVKFISARRGEFPDGYLQALDYPVELPQQVPAVQSMREHTLSVEVLAQLVKRNTSVGANAEKVEGDEDEIETLSAEGVKDPSEVAGRAEDFPLQEVGDYSTYQYTCTVLNGTLAQVQTLQQLLHAELLALKCAQVIVLSAEDEAPKEEEFAPKPEEQTGIFRERGDLGDPCLPGALAVWDPSVGEFVMVPSAYLFVPGVPRVYNTTAEVVLARWTCMWPEAGPEDDEGEEEVEGEVPEGVRSSASSAQGKGACAGGNVDEGADSCDSNSRGRNDEPIVHTHTHYATLAPGSAPNSRRLRLQYNITLPPYTDASTVDGAAVSLTGKVVVVVMPRAWETLPPACSLPQLLHELQSEWVYSADGTLNEAEEAGLTVDLDDPSPQSPPEHQQQRQSLRDIHHSSSVGTSRFEKRQEIGEAGGTTAPAGIVLVHSRDFISPVVEVDSAYLGEASVIAPLRVVSHNYGSELVDQLQAQAASFTPALSSLACGISRTAEQKKEDVEEDPDVGEDAEFSFEFGRSTYRTLDGVNLKSKAVGCQTAFIVIPEGYEIVPALPDILTYVVGEYHWGTEKLLLADGFTYATKLALDVRPGKQMREVPLEWEVMPRAPAEGEGGNHSVVSASGADVIAIRPGVCASRILIRTRAVMVPYGGFFYHTLDLAEVAGSAAGCQDGPLVLPSFLDVAPAISDVINNIVSAYGWDTDVLVLQNRRGYFTARAGADLAGKMCCERKELLYVADQPRNNRSSGGEAEDTLGGSGGGSSGGNHSAPHWRDTEQVLSVLRCNARILVRQPIVTYIYNDTAAPSTLQFLEQRKTTQSVAMNVTRVSYGATTSSGKNNSQGKRSTSGYMGKLLPGVVKSHIYSLSLRLCYTLFTHGGVDLMNIKVTRMAEVPADALLQLKNRVQGAATSSEEYERSPKFEDSNDDKAVGVSQLQSSDGKERPKSQQSSSSAPQQQHDEEESAAAEDPLRGINAAHSSELCEDFAAEFQTQRNAWGKRLGAAMDHLDDHILGNVPDAATRTGDFIYRPASFTAQPQVVSETVAAEAALESRVDRPPQSVDEVFEKITERVTRVRVARQRLFRAGSAAAADTATVTAGAAAEGARAVSALLVETSPSQALFLLQYQEDGVVYASYVSTVATTSAQQDLVSITSAARVAAKSATAVTEDQLVTWEAQEGAWRVQQRWTEVTTVEATVVELLRAMQMAADSRGTTYSEESNDSHMSQEDGRRFLGVAVGVAQYLQI